MLMPHTEAPAATSLYAMCSPVQSDRNSVMMLIKINSRAGRVDNSLQNRGEKLLVWLTSPDRSTSYAAQAVLSAEGNDHYLLGFCEKKGLRI